MSLDDDDDIGFFVDETPERSDSFRSESTACIGRPLSSSTEYTTASSPGLKSSPVILESDFPNIPWELTTYLSHSRSGYFEFDKDVGTVRPRGSTPREATPKPWSPARHSFQGALSPPPDLRRSPYVGEIGTITSPAAQDRNVMSPSLSAGKPRRLVASSSYFGGERGQHLTSPGSDVRSLPYEGRDISAGAHAQHAAMKSMVSSPPTKHREPSISEEYSIPTYRNNPWSTSKIGKPDDEATFATKSSYPTYYPKGNSKNYFGFISDMALQDSAPSNETNARIKNAIEFNSRTESIALYGAKDATYYFNTKEVAIDGIIPADFFEKKKAATDFLVYQVQFKHTFRDFITYPTAPLHIAIDDYVRVEADRGEDIGVVRQIFRTKNESQIRNLGGILRLATPEEKYMLPIKAHEETQAVDVCRRKTFEHQLPMTIVDAEYQFDRRKLTFFFDADGRVDFRDMVTDLYAIYRTRIWMEQIVKDHTDLK